MQKIKAIYTITRFPNLVFIFLSQVLVHYKLILPFLKINNQSSIYNPILLALSTTLIAAAGYIINDYFDVKIDEINKPKRVTVELQFKRRYIIFYHSLINFFALLLIVPTSYRAGHISLVGFQLLCITLLVFYSSHFKRKPLIGNIVVALMSFFTVITPAIYTSNFIEFENMYFKFLILIAVYAFMLTLIREIVKDLEDLKGDEADGCKTLPLVIGIRKTKQLLFVLATIMVIIFTPYVCYKLYSTQILFLTSSIFIGFLLLFFLFNLIKSIKHKQFKFLSRLLKIITFIGVLQILLIQ